MSRVKGYYALYYIEGFDHSLHGTRSLVLETLSIDTPSDAKGLTTTSARSRSTWFYKFVSLPGSFRRSLGQLSSGLLCRNWNYVAIIQKPYGYGNLDLVP